MISRRNIAAGLLVTAGVAALRFPATQAGNFPSADVTPWALKLIAAAISQIGRTTIYDPAYVALSYPMGDVPIERGVCSDVIIRAYREAFAIDLQELVHEDIRRNFASYPKRWGLKRPDRNIDHRRVLNLNVFFERQNAALPVSDRSEDYRAGDIVSQVLPSNLPHMALVTHRANKDRSRPLVIHNIGFGTRLEDRLFAYRITGHFRFAPPQRS